MSNSMYKYSPITRGWYLESFHGIDIPTDAVPVSEEDYHALRAAEASGIEIVPNAAGYPVALPRPPMSEREALLNARADISRQINATARQYGYADLDALMAAFRRLDSQ